MRKKLEDKIDFEVKGMQEINTFPLINGFHFPLIGQIILVTTLNRQQIPNVAPKSWVSILARQPAIVGFSCNVAHDTAKNILTTGEFVINIPGAELAEKVWKASELKGQDAGEIQKVGLTPLKSVKLTTPRIAECKAHLECSLDWTKKYRDEIIIFGKVLLASIDKKALEGTPEERYKYLKLITYLEDGTYGVIKTAMKVDQS
ncbi:MAG: flavin reductase family protein [candidate division Zixibacteria bacterium]|nr:flavin reductase family protein [candidate division Zixibacteria bacterium]